MEESSRDVWPKGNFLNLNVRVEKYSKKRLENQPKYTCKVVDNFITKVTTN